MGFEDKTPSGSRWRQLYATGGPRAILPRTALVNRVLGDSAPWTAILGAPGMGKSTLLSQIGTAFQDRGAHVEHIALISRTSPPPALEAAFEAASQRQRKGEGDTVVLVDDFDWFNLQEQAEWLAAALQESGARLVTASVDSPAWAISDREILAEIGSSEINLSRLEHLALLELTFPDGVDPFADELIWQVAQGGAAGTAFGIECLVNAAGNTEVIKNSYSELLGVSMQVCSEDVPQASNGRGMLSVSRLVRMLPQISSKLVATLLGEAAAGAFDNLYRQPTLLLPSPRRTGTFEWAETFWQAFDDTDEEYLRSRAALADQVAAIPAPIDELWQRLLLRDWRRSELLLTRHFAEAELLLPAAVAKHLSASDTSRYPLCHALRLSGEDAARAPEFRARTREFADQKPLFGGGIHAVIVSALQGRAALGLGARELSQLHLERSWAGLREIPAKHFGQRGTLTAVSLISQSLAARGDWISAWRMLRFLAAKGGLTSQDEEAKQAIEAMLLIGDVRPGDCADTEPHANPRALASELILRHGLSAATWRMLDAGHPGFAADIIGPGRRRFSFPTAGIAQTAHVLALLLDGRSEDAQNLFQQSDAAGAVEMQSPVFLWAGALVAQSRGNQLGAARIIERIPASHPVFELACTMYRAITGESSRLRGELPVHRSYGGRGISFRGILDAVDANKEDAHSRAVAAAAAAIRDSGRGAVALVLRLLPRREVEGLLEAAVRLSDGPRGTASSSATLQHALSARLELPDLFFESDSASPLTEREFIMLKAISQGLSLAEMAKQEFVSVNTVKTQINSLKRKLGVTGRRELALEAAVKRGWFAWDSMS